MTTRPISMSKLHSILRLKYSAQLSRREIARSLNISPGTVANYLKKANKLGLNQWPIPEGKQQNTFLGRGESGRKSCLNIHKKSVISETNYGLFTII